MGLRDTLVHLGFAMITIGASYATWALLTGPLGRYTKLGPQPTRSRKPRAKRDVEDGPRT